MTKPLPLNHKVESIMRELLAAGHTAHIVGGACRDAIISEVYHLAWVEPRDYDVFTDASGEQILELFPGKVIGNEERQEKILTVVYDGVEISQYRKSGDRKETTTDILEHFLTCDFTINAIAADIDGNYYDNHGGIDDIKRGIIRTVGNPIDRYKEDYLRVLRLLRFYMKYHPYGFNINLGTYTEALRVMGKVMELPAPRIHAELMKMLRYGSVEEAEMLLAFGVLDKLIPEMADCYSIADHGKWHPETLEKHIKVCFANACSISRNPLVRLSAYFHDVGKAQAYDKEKKTFYQHHKYGSAIVRERLPKWAFTNAEIAYISGMSYNHMADLNNVKQVNKLVRELNSFGATFEDFCVMAWSDRNANQYWAPAGYNEWLQNFKPYQLYKESFKHPTALTIKDLAVDGKDLIKEGLDPGPAIGKVLTDLLDKVDGAELVNERYALIPEARRMIGEILYKEKLP